MVEWLERLPGRWETLVLVPSTAEVGHGETLPQAQTFGVQTAGSKVQSLSATR